MNDERLILQQLDYMGKEISSLTDSARTLRELRDDLSPMVNETVKVLIKELAEVEPDFTLEDLGYLMKNVMRSVRNINWSLDQLKSLIDFLRTVEPLLKSSVPQSIQYLDQLERQGIFQILSAMLAVMQRIAQTYTPEDFEQIGEGLVHLVGVAKETYLTECPEPFGQGRGNPCKVGSVPCEAGRAFRRGVCFARP